LKVDIPEFEGQLDPDLFLDWLRTVEWVFNYKYLLDEKKVKLVALELRERQIEREVSPLPLPSRQLP